jgi:MFS family permease
LCEPKWRIGLIGSLYFTGVVSTILLIPWLTDKFGRRWIVIICYTILIIAAIGLMLASDITTLYILVFIIGATFGGRIIGGLNWLVEWQQARKKELVVFIKMMTVTAWIILMTAIFQFGTKHWLIVAAIFITLCVIGTIYVVISVPESSEYLHGKERYDEAREGLIDVAN